MIETPAPSTPAGVEQFLRKHDPTSYCALRALDTLHGGRVNSHRADIFRFLTERYGEIPLDRYIRRQRRLRELQSAFERRTAYEAASYADVPSIDGEDYRLALLLSFVLTNHRFEILSALEDFLRSRSDRGARELLSIGFGTGYELKLTRDILPDWRYHAYDSAPESFRYAADLLATFDCPGTGLHTELFPLEGEELPDVHRNRYGKIVLCEILEHLEHPELALRNMRTALHNEGELFATMAVNIAQEDHIFLYRSKEDARSQVERAGLTIAREFVTPVTVMPFAEHNREMLFTKGNYVCVLRKN